MTTTTRITSLIALCLLASCGAPRAALPADEVLRNAALAAPGMQSAAFKADATIAELVPGLAPISFAIDGTLTDGGQQMLFSFDASTSHPGLDDKSRLSGAVAVGGEEDVYLRFDAIEGAVLEAVFGPEAKTTWVGRWWKISSSDPSQGPPITPDPSILKMQSQVLAVDVDHGIERIEGADAYHYSVHVDGQKLRAYLQAVAEARGDKIDPTALDQQVAAFAATGDVWIDADSFYLRKVRWSVGDASKPGGFSVTLQALLTSINAAGPIELPSQADPFPMNVEDLLPQRP